MESSTQNSLNYGLVAHYPFNGNALDASGNQNNGTVMGATLATDRYGMEQSSYQFDGGDWIELPQPRLLDQKSNASITAWYSLSSNAGTGQIISSGDYRGGNDPIHLRIGLQGLSDFHWEILVRRLITPLLPINGIKLPQFFIQTIPTQPSPSI